MASEWYRPALTFLVSRQAEEDIPSWHKDHIIPEILALDLCLLHDHNVRLQNLEHGLNIGER